LGGGLLSAADFKARGASHHPAIVWITHRGRSVGRTSIVGGFVVAIALAAAPLARADEGADALLKRVEAATAAVQTLTADVTMVWSPLPGNTSVNFAKPGQATSFRTTGKLHFNRPNLARIELTKEATGKKSVQISDGTHQWRWDSASAECQKSAVDPGGENISFAIGWPSFFKPDFATAIEDEVGTAHYLGTETIDGVEYRVVEMTALTRVTRWYVGGDNLVHRARADTKITGGDQRLETILSNVVTGASLRDETFHADPPADKKIVMFKSVLDDLLPVGAEAPAFELPSATGEKLTLASIRQGHRVTIVYFWNFGCGACVEKLPHVQKLYERVASQGLEVVAVHYGYSPAEDREAQKKLNTPGLNVEYSLGRLVEYSRTNGITFKLVSDFSGKTSDAYKIQGFPTVYLLDDSGKIVFHTAGLSMRKLQEELKKVGIE
jgi:thiol-disulfide isomerase/thioredoxin/outer membrane lipoprotein-sorting protein